MSWGNILFEESLIYAGLGQDWEKPLHEAVEKFREGIIYPIFFYFFLIAIVHL